MIRPISRDNDANRAKDVTKNLETSKQPMTENNSVQKVSKVEHKNLRDEKKETLIIEKEPPFVPIESWKENSTQVMTNNSPVRHGCQFLLNLLFLYSFLCIRIIFFVGLKNLYFFLIDTLVLLFSLIHVVEIHYRGIFFILVLYHIQHCSLEPFAKIMVS